MVSKTLNPFGVHLKLSQHRSLATPQYKIKSLKKELTHRIKHLTKKNKYPLWKIPGRLLRGCAISTVS